MSDQEEKTQNFGDERQILEEAIPCDPTRPVYTAIRAAFIKKFAQFYLLMCETTAPEAWKRGTVAPEMVSPETPELERLDKECMKLATLLFRRSNLWAGRDWRKPPILKFLRRTISYSRGGRPATKLHIAVQAKEMRLADRKRWTWPKLRDALCDCGKSEHDIRCQDNLRREVAHLERLLSEFGHTI